MKKIISAVCLLLCCVISMSLALPAMAGSTITYIHNDVAGSPIAASDSAGNMLWKESYYPYGEQLKHTGDSGNKVWFHGKPFEASTGLSYFGARYYSPLLGRFTGMDPVDVDPMNVHSLNKYAYGNNNPYKYTDPDGRNAVYIAKFSFRVGWQVGKEISSIYEQVNGVSIGVAIWNATHKEVDDSSNGGTSSASGGAPGDPDEGDVDKKEKGKSPNQLNKVIKQGKAPKDVERVDVGKVKGEQTHAHFKDGSALNKDGTWKHGESTLSRATQKWLENNGWTLPNE